MHEGLKPNDEALMTTVYTTAAMPSFPIGAQRALKASSWGLCPQRRVKTPWLGFAYARAKVLTLCPPFSPKGRGSDRLNTCLQLKPLIATSTHSSTVLLAIL